MRYPFSYVIPVFIAALVVAGFYLGGVGFFAFPIAMVLLVPVAEEIAGTTV